MDALSTRPEAADAVRLLARRHLVDQLGRSAQAGDAGQRELKRLFGWLDTRKYPLGHDEIGLACGHTARLLGAIARVQAAQATGALALARLDGRGVVQRIVVERAGVPSAVAGEG
jgi:hypothetical protein